MTAALTTIVFVASKEVEDRQVVQPPDMFLMTQDDVGIKGLQGSYCWTNDEGRSICVDKLAPEETATKAAVMSQDVAQGTKYRLKPGNYSEPDTMTYRLLDSEGNVLEEGDAQDGFTLNRGAGTYLLVVDARWEKGDASYIYQLQVTADG
jgi:hypothetical protein